MNKEIEDKVKELSRRIVGTGQIVVAAESLTGGMISSALTSIPGRERMVRAWFRDLHQSSEARDAGRSAVYS